MRLPLIILMSALFVPSLDARPVTEGNRFSISGDQLLINDKPFKMIGLRTSNALISDEATQQLIDHLDVFKSHGVNTVSVFYMGSRFGDVKGYRSDASLDPRYAARMGRIIEAADSRGMIVLVGCLYWSTSRAKEDLGSWKQADANRAVANTVRWLRNNNHRNVLVDPDNEGMAHDAKGWSIESMIDAAHAVDPTIMVGYNDSDPPPSNADLYLHHSPKVKGSPWIQSEGSAPNTPGGYWGSYSKKTHKKTGYHNYSRIGRYTAGMKAGQVKRARQDIDKYNGYIMASTWLQCAPLKGAGGPFHKPGGSSNIPDVNKDIDSLHPQAGIRWWLEAMRETYGAWQPSALPPDGQIVIDPKHPAWLKRQGGRHVFICGPGDPEDFLYLGRRRPDGTRDGDQVARIDKLIKHGGNCIYLQAVRSHGGDGGKDHNPFVDSDPSKGVIQAILKQWEEWFTRMDKNNILIYFFIYDDGSRPWGKGERVPSGEEAFLRQIVARFKHHRNLIWIVAEESEEAFNAERVQAIAGVIKSADDRGHIVGTHHHSGAKFKFWRKDGPINHFSMQYNKPVEGAHTGAVEAFRNAAGRYQVIHSENTVTESDLLSAWASALGGCMPMLIRMDIASTPPAELKKCRILQKFFESTNFWTMAPHDELAIAGTQWILADPGRSAIAYAQKLKGKMGIRDLPAARYSLTWVDCASGVRREATSDHGGGDASFSRPEGIGPWCALWLRR